MGTPQAAAETGATPFVEPEPRTLRETGERAVARGEIPPGSPAAARLPHLPRTRSRTC
ncbi:hypothetical protein [Streptomyces sp. NPDC008092]|uniref:hypothetical protein n=1 Tax=Streptomyces sp. NPDC008092 TaxID=3364808 RepID=UPI0036F0118B